MTQPLHLQYLPAAVPSTKIGLALLSKALCDALGGPAEFQPRFTFPFVSQMQPNDNFGLPAGVWTDDTSMALALARSIATFETETETESRNGPRGGMDAADQLDAYYRWWQDGELSAIGHFLSRRAALRGRRQGREKGSRGRGAGGAGYGGREKGQAA
ncbi:hypothetical protein B0H12DRAFT_1079215 [Mycena haematopus]|nr:hypothetical protein B0H12DRAFT_1079215 [Mycena haematopus]